MSARRDTAGFGTGKCDRCHVPTRITGMSWFNTEMCCPKCLEEERQHPDFQKAVEADGNAVRAGDFNFPGIGKPDDL